MASREGKVHNRKHHERRVKRMGKQIAYEMGMDHMDLVHVFSRAESDEATHACLADCKWEYRLGRFIWNLDAIAAMSDDSLHDSIVHEYVHMLMAPLHQALQKSKHYDPAREEFATECIARAIITMKERG